MQHLQSFDKFLERKAQEEKNKAKYESRKKNFLKALSALYGDIEKKWLSQYIRQRKISAKKTTTQITEDYVGTYRVKQMEIKIGLSSVYLIPVGAFIIDAYGRVDIQGKTKSIPITLDKNNRWMVLVNWGAAYTYYQEKELDKNIFEKILQELI